MARYPGPEVANRRPIPTRALPCDQQAPTYSSELKARRRADRAILFGARRQTWSAVYHRIIAARISFPRSTLASNHRGAPGRSASCGAIRAMAAACGYHGRLWALLSIGKRAATRRKFSVSLFQRNERGRFLCPDSAKTCVSARGIERPSGGKRQTPSSICQARA